MRTRLLTGLLTLCGLATACQPTAARTPDARTEVGESSSDVTSVLATDIALRSSSVAALDASTGPGTTLTVAAPAGVAAGDVVLAEVTSYASVTIAPAAGFTEVRTITDSGTTVAGAALRTSIFTRLATSTEPAGYSFTFSAKSRGVAAAQAFINVDPKAPIDDEATGVATASSATQTTPALTTSAAREVLVGVFGAVNPHEPASATSTMSTEVADRSSGNTGSWGIELAVYASNPRASAGSESGRPATFSSATDTATMSLLALKQKPLCTVSSKLVPSCGAWWGIAETIRSGETDATALARIEGQVGRQFDIQHSYHKGNEAFPTADEVKMSDEGRLLLLNWKPDPASWAKVAAGSEDASVVVPVANRLKAFGKPLFLALYHEPENDIPNVGNPADYVAMWKHVRSVFDARGVTNVVWVWDMMGFSGHSAHYLSGDLYPGDALVDWIAYDPYSNNPATTDFLKMTNDGASGSWPGFYTWATTTHPTKPLMLAEFGADDTATTPAKRAAWFNESLVELKAGRPAIKAAVYFDLYNWVLSADAPSLAAYAAIGHDAYVNPAHP